MSKYERFGVNAVARLVDPISNSATALEVTTTDGFPTDGNFRITIGREILLVTAISGSVFTVARGQEGSTAVAHDGGAPVRQTITAGAIEQAFTERVPIARDTARPLMNTLVNSSGTALTVSSFTWVNQGTATASDLNSGGISLVDPGSSATDNLRMLTRSAPTAPWTLTAAFVPQLHDSSNASMGIGVRHAAGGYVNVLGTFRTDQVAVLEFSAPTTFGSNLLALGSWFMGRHIQWFQIEDNNTNVIFRTSMDGINWQDLHSHARASQLNLNAPDQILFYVNPLSTTLSCSMALVAWEEA